MKVLVHECDPVKDNKRDLPVNAYIVRMKRREQRSMTLLSAPQL